MIDFNFGKYSPVGYGQFLTAIPLYTTYLRYPPEGILNAGVQLIKSFHVLHNLIC
jgi:hypothetical protein